MTEPPAWGTPPSPADRRRDAEHPDLPGPEPVGFVLIVEQLTGSSDSAVWRVDPDPIPAGALREHARDAALKLARTFQPRHPMSPRSRRIYRVDDDNLIVLVAGMTKTFHFRVSVAEQLS
jgi:hypothetical protein